LIGSALSGEARKFFIGGQIQIIFLDKEKLYILKYYILNLKVKYV